MLFSFKGRGILVPIYVAVSVFATMLFALLLKEFGLDFKYDSLIILGTGVFLSGIWTYFKSEDYITVNGKKEKVFLNNQLYFLPLKTWAYILMYGGVLIFLSGIVATLDKLKLI